jgi:hypothetical protein
MNFNGIKEIISGLDDINGGSNYVSQVKLGGSDIDKLYKTLLGGSDIQIEQEDNIQNLFEDIKIEGGSYSVDGFSLFVNGGAVKKVDDHESLFVDNDNPDLGKSSLKDLLNQF